MSLVLNTNVDSLVAQNSLTSSGSALSTALQQLSSGLRINTAADDAAGYAIVQGFTSQVNGLNQAAQNASNGVSLAQTAQGALTEVTNDLQTMRDLAVESLNATNNGTDRSNLNQEFQQLSADIDNVAKTTSFNGVNLLDGTFAGATFQIGANAGQTIQVASVASARTSALGQTFSATIAKGPATAALTAGEVVINGDSVGATATDGVSFANSTFSGIAVANAINAANISGVSATANATNVTAGAAVGAGPYTLAANDLVINGISVTGTVGNVTPETDTIGLINAQTNLTGVTAADNAGKIELTAADGRNITVTATANGTLASGFATATATTEGTVTLNSINTTQAAAAIAISAGGGGITTSTTAATLNSGTVSNANILTVPASNSALSTIDSALQAIASTGAQLGAYQNRFTAAISGINIDSTNLQAARSSIQDTDFAAATSALSRAQILQQSSTAMVAQANTVPQNVLTLLQKLP
jgi:flagellin